MSFAQGSESRIAYIAEVTPGTTPASPTTTVLPTVKLDLDLVQDTYEDNSIYGDRMERFAVQGLRHVAGTFSGNLSHTNFSSIIQTLMCSTWSSNVIKTGKTLQTITLEKWHSDIAKGFVATGCFADKAQIKIPVKGLATIDATISGFNMVTESSALTSSPTAAVVETPYTHINGTIKEGGTTIAYITSVDISIDNSAQALDVLGSQVPVGYTLGMSKVSGSVTVYVPDLVLFNKFLNQTGTSLDFTLTDGTNTLEFFLPNVVYTASKIPVQGQGALVQTLQFKALEDTVTTNSNLVITRS